MENCLDEKTKKEVEAIHQVFSEKFKEIYFNAEQKKIYQKNPMVYQVAFMAFATETFVRALIALGMKEDEMLKFFTDIIDSGYVAQEIEIIQEKVDSFDSLSKFFNTKNP